MGRVTKKKTGVSFPGLSLKGVVVILVSLLLAACFAPMSDIPFRPGKNFTSDLSLTFDLATGGTDSDPEWLTEYNGRLLFAADDPVVGRELFSYNGNSLKLVADLNPGAADSSPEGLIEYKGDLYFAATTPSTGYEIWRYDGSSVSGVGEIDPGVDDGIFSFDPVIYEDHLFFEGYRPAGDRELYYYHPSFAAPQLFEDINPFASSFPDHFAVLNDVLYFYAETGAFGPELYRLTGLDQPVVTAAYRANPSDLLPRYLTPYDGKLYFVADSNLTLTAGDNELWVYDPQGFGPANTRAQKVESINDFDDNIIELYVHDGKLYLAGTAGGFGWELYVFDGTSITEIDVNGENDPSNPGWFTTYDGDLYMSATSSDYGDEVWKLSNGVPTPVTDTVPGSGGAFPYELTVVGNTLYMGAATAATGYELFTLSSGR
jgi:ELWxxDGT repeat protein